MVWKILVQLIIYQDTMLQEGVKIFKYYEVLLKRFWYDNGSRNCSYVIDIYKVRLS